MTGGLIVLGLLALLCAYGLRWVSGRMRLPMPAYMTVIVVFVLVVAALYGQSLD